MTSYIGQRLKRFEDPQLLRGQGSYVDDKTLPGMLHAVFVRSPHPHARIQSIDTAAAKAFPGVAAVLTSQDIGDALGQMPLFPLEGDPVDVPAHPILAGDKVCYVGQPVAIVAGQDRYTVRDAAELVKVTYQPLPHVVDPLEAVKEGAPLIHEKLGSNVALRLHKGSGDIDAACAAADRVVRQHFHLQRITAAPMEGRAVLASYQPEDDLLTFWTSTQVPHVVRTCLSETLGRPEESIRVIAPDVGGGFGQKGDPFPEDVALAHLAVQLRRPVKWVEDRNENMYASHARGYEVDVEAAVKNDGTLLGLRVQAVSDIGAYFIGTSAVPPFNFLHRTIGPYKTPVAQLEILMAITNKPTTGPYRGAGGPEGAFCMERTMDLIADELGLEPTQVRKVNLLSSEAFPYTTPTGYVYDSGNYAPALDRAMELADYEGLRERQRRRTPQDPLIGVGVATFMKATGGVGAMRHGNARVVVDPSGRVRVYTEVSPHGQGQETSFAQITADVLGITPDQAEVLHGDTATAPPGWGSVASRGTPIGGSAIYEALQVARQSLATTASQLLECPEEDVAMVDGRVFNRQDPEQAMSFSELASAAYRAASDQPSPLEFEASVDLPNHPFSFGAQVVAVEIDPGTGDLRFLRYAAVQDCGKVINPLLVDGQVEGAIAQGFGQAMTEELAYSEDGQPLAGTFMDYAIPTAEEFPPLALGWTETPSPTNPLGVKGIGEVATVGAPPAIANAVMDALSSAGVRHIDTPLTPEKLWRALQEARR